MQRALVLVILAVLAAACGKKQPPAAPKSPAPTDPAQDADKATGEGAPDTAPRETSADPCEGGENK